MINNIENIKEKRFLVEESLLACVISKPKLFDNIKEEYFYHKKNQNIYKAIKSLVLQEAGVSKKSVIALLVDRSGKEKWAAELDRICYNANPNEFKVYSDLLKKYYTYEKFIEISSGVQERILEEGPSALYGGVNQLSNIKIEDGQHSFTIDEALDSTLEKVKEAQESGVAMSSPFNVKALDEPLGGAFPDDFIIIAGRPSMGKTTLATFISHETNAPSGFISSEMSKEALANKYLSIGSGVPAEYLRRADLLSKTDVENLIKASEKIKGKSFYINEKADISISELEKQAKEWVDVYGIKILWVDYLQRIKHDNPKLSRTEQVGDIARRLKDLAKKLKITVIALAQLNRNVEGRANHMSARPKMADLKESGDIEQEADIIMLLHRDSYQKKESNNISLIELIYAKVRQGRVGTEYLEFVPSTQKYRTPNNNSMPLDGGF